MRTLGNSQETIDHLFVCCDFTRWVLNEALDVAGALVKLDTAMNFEEAATELNKVSRGTPAWGLQWNIYGITLFHIWKQRNQKARREEIKARCFASSNQND